MRDRSPYPARDQSPDSAGATGHLTSGRARLLLETAVAAHIADARARGLSERTVEFYVAGIASYARSLRLDHEPLLADMTLDRTRAWAAGLRASRSPATAHGRVRALKTFACRRSVTLASGQLRSESGMLLAWPKTRLGERCALWSEPINPPWTRIVRTSRIVAFLEIDSETGP